MVFCGMKYPYTDRELIKRLVRGYADSGESLGIAGEAWVKEVSNCHGEGWTSRGCPGNEPSISRGYPGSSININNMTAPQLVE